MCFFLEKSHIARLQINEAVNWLGYKVLIITTAEHGKAEKLETKITYGSNYKAGQRAELPTQGEKQPCRRRAAHR